MWQNMWAFAFADAERAEAERDRLRAAVDAALALHVWVPPVATHPGFCAGCGDEDRPCATVRALAAAAPTTTEEDTPDA
jgi:hypothetical protein